MGKGGGGGGRGRRSRQVTTSDLAVVVVSLKRKVDKVERKLTKHIKDDEGDTVVHGFRLRQDDEDEDATPDEVRRRS